MSAPERVQKRLSAGEERFDALRRRAGAILAPLAFAYLWFSPPAGLAEAPAQLAAIEVAVVLLCRCKRIISNHV